MTLIDDGPRTALAHRTTSVVMKRKGTRSKAGQLMAELGVRENDRVPVTARSFRAARKLWVSIARDARKRGDGDTERAANVLWNEIAKWRCSVCGELKWRRKALTCARPGCVHDHRYGLKWVGRRAG